MGTKRTTIQSDETLFAIIDGMKELDGGTPTELADHANVSKSTAHRHLSSLVENGYVLQEGNTYRLGFRFLDLGGFVRNRNPAYKKMKTTALRLANELGEVVSFLVEEDGFGVFVYRELGPQAVYSEGRVGKRTHLHQTAAGKAMLMSLPDELIAEILDRYGLPAKTSNTITSRDELWSEIERDRERGYTDADGEYTEGLSSVGAPVRGPDGEVLGGLSVNGPTHRLAGERADEVIPKKLLSVINEFELNISYF